ncbi:hypothetical protein Glove_87g225 [Diversispora epigaea]|uniref:TLDc domain-containing protein n=1 Tax=Diversispora epigaea TaxID=1348612 RepID=A0A397J6C3_9GLOM|nr:hypothetical protein Glove_87g225 [Diversispora epigaea]
MAFKFFDKLSQDFAKLLNDKKEYNVVIEVDKEENMKSFTTHSVVLRYRLPYFDKELENATTNENHIKTIIKPNISAQIFEIILKYIYGSIVNIEDTDTKTIYELMVNTNELELKELSVKLESYLIESKASWLKTHFSFVYHSIFDSDKFKDLKKFYNDIIVKYPNLIFESEDFTSLQEKALISILERDDLNVEEIKIWDYVIKWGIAQNPTLPADSKEWTKGNFKALKITLQQCLSLIRYFHIPASWLKTHFSFVYHSIFDSDKFKDLKKFYNDIIVKYPNLIFESEDFTSLQEKALISILERDDLNVEEIKIWDYVIKWGIAQNPTLPADSKEWTKGNFKALKITLQQCLSLIRYFHIPGEVIWKKMKPYKKIFEKQLWDDITQYFISPNEPITFLVLPARIVSNPELPSRVNEPFSTIINNEHVAELSSWIDRRPTIYSLANIPYEFQLILRGSRDGFHPKTFWNMCNEHVGTIVVAKVAGTDEIIGGYNPLAWDKLTEGGYMKTNDSFIFSLKNGNIQNSILSRVKNCNNALYNRDSNDQNIYGPEFGDCEFVMKSDASDFTQDKQYYCDNYYEKPIRTVSGEFSISDYEEENMKSFNAHSVVLHTDTKTIYELMVNANELELKEQSMKLESYLIESNASWLKTHFSLVYCSIFDVMNLKV